MNILFLTDIHGTAKNPSSRLDIYYLTSLKKMYEVGQIIKTNKVDVVLIGGDLFHTPRVSNKYAGDIASIIKSWGVDVYIVPGNHDIYGYNIDTVDQTSLGLLAKSKVVTLLTRNNPIKLDIGISNSIVSIEGQEYYSDIDKGNASDYEAVETGDYKILVAHGFLLPKPFVPGVPVTLIKDVITDANLVLTGHYHNGYKEVLHDSTLFINPGSTMRVDNSDTRMPQCVIVNLEEVYGKVEMEFIYIPFKTAKPAGDVFDLNLKAANKITTNSLALFKQTIQNTATLQNVITIPDMVKAIATSSKIDANITTGAMKYIGLAQASSQDLLPEVKGFVEKPGIIYMTGIDIHNFQSHTDTKLTFMKGLNILSGETNSGKSSVFRAMQWCLYNEPKGSAFITTGETDCNVTVYMSDGSYVKRERTVTSAGSYEIREVDGTVQTYKGFNNDIPIEVTNAHQMPEVYLAKDFKVKLNIASQLDGPFLVGDSPIAKAAAVGRLIGVETIDDAIKSVGRDILGCSKEIKLVNKKLDVNEKELKRFDNLKDTKYFMEAYQCLIDTHDYRESTIGSLKKINNLYTINHAEICEVESDLNNIVDLKPAMEFVECSERLFDEISILTNLSSGFKVLSTQITEVEDELKNLPHEGVYDEGIELLEQLMSETMFMLQLKARHTVNQKQETVLEGYMAYQDTTAIDLVINKVSSDIFILTDLALLNNEYNNSKGLGSDLISTGLCIKRQEEKDYHNIEEVKVLMTKLLVDTKLCPTCGTELDLNHISNILNEGEI